MDIKDVRNIFFFEKKEICDKMATLTENTDTRIDPL